MKNQVAGYSFDPSKIVCIQPITVDADNDSNCVFSFIVKTDSGDVNVERKVKISQLIDHITRLVIDLGNWVNGVVKIEDTLQYLQFKYEWDNFSIEYRGFLKHYLK